MLSNEELSTKRKVRGCDLATAAQRLEGPDFVDAEQGKAVLLADERKRCQIRA